jgi:hypothetical protein
MRYPIVATMAVAATLGVSAAAFAQSYYAPPVYAPPPGPYYQPYPPAAYPPPPVTYAPYWDGIHSNGGAARAYSYWGGQKSN